MSLQGYFIVYGSLATVLALVIGGIVAGGPWGHAAIALGTLGALGCTGFAIWLAVALNTDI